MSLRFSSAIAALSLILPAVLSAQLSSNEEERIAALSRDGPDWKLPKTTISVGVRFLTSGTTVNYGNLGTVPFQQVAEPGSAGKMDRVYDNGTVLADGVRENEKDADGNQIPPDANGRYILTSTDADGVTTVTGDFLSYVAGLTRNWSYGSSSQLTDDGYMAFSNYSATSEGGTAAKKEGLVGGVEFQLSRTIGKITKRLEWSLLAGIALNDINNKVNGSVVSTLHTNTDYYFLNGRTIPDAPYEAPSFQDITDADGNVLVASGIETTVPISELPDDARSTESITAGGATVQGNWQIKGAYFMLRLGPSLRARITERLGLSASVGVAGAYSGTRYIAVETFAVPDVENAVVTTTEESSIAKFLSGYYADFNLEWAASDRTGLFGGVSAQRFGDYDQTVGGRTANIDLGNSVGIRGGVSVKF